MNFFLIASFPDRCLLVPSQKMCFINNHPSKPTKLTCMGGLTNRKCLGEKVTYRLHGEPESQHCFGHICISESYDLIEKRLKTVNADKVNSPKASDASLEKAKPKEYLKSKESQKSKQGRKVKIQSNKNSS